MTERWPEWILETKLEIWPWVFSETLWKSQHTQMASWTNDKEVYIADISYQKFVLEHCGVNVTGTYLVCLNGDYVFDGKLDLNKLFYISDVSEEVKVEMQNIDPNLALAEKILQSEEGPDIDLSMGCHKPYHCAFWKYCSRDLPSESVFNLYRMVFSKKLEYYRKGWITYKDLYENAPISEFLNKLSYPLYFLDFETMQPVIPEFVGTKPYAQRTFQYSLHFIEHEGGELNHKEFLAESGTVPG